MNKKLQVFVSSTYKDLIEERQAAVEAILDAGHIPAGMELFKAGNESQLKTIYKWIDESDVYMLILGGRYGSIESKSGKSYTQLEYEYALSKNIPVFAVVLSQSFLTVKINDLGLQNAMDSTDKYQTFKLIVMSKIIKEVDDCKDIKIAIHSTLNEFINQYELSGWVRNIPENDFSKILIENNNLLKGKSRLEKELSTVKSQLEKKTFMTIGNYTYEELIEIFSKKTFVLSKDIITTSPGNDKIDALTFFYANFHQLCTGITNRASGSTASTKFIYYKCAPYYIGFGLMELVKLTGTTAQRARTTKLGSDFYSMLEANGHFR